MYIHLDHHTGEPIYRQIMEQIKYKIACGELAPGDQLPSIRGLARELKINPRTVVKVYEELRHGGLVIMKQGQGVFITNQQDTVPSQIRHKLITEMARRLLAEATRLGAHPSEIMDILHRESGQIDTRGIAHAENIDEPTELKIIDKGIQNNELENNPSEDTDRDE